MSMPTSDMLKRGCSRGCLSKIFRSVAESALLVCARHTFVRGSASSSSCRGGFAMNFMNEDGEFQASPASQFQDPHYQYTQHHPQEHAVAQQAQQPHPLLSTDAVTGSCSDQTQGIAGHETHVGKISAPIQAEYSTSNKVAHGLLYLAVRIKKSPNQVIYKVQFSAALLSAVQRNVRPNDKVRIQGSITAAPGQTSMKQSASPTIITFKAADIWHINGLTAEHIKQDAQSCASSSSSPPTHADSAPRPNPFTAHADSDPTSNPPTPCTAHADLAQSSTLSTPSAAHADSPHADSARSPSADSPHADSSPLRPTTHASSPSSSSTTARPDPRPFSTTNSRSQPSAASPYADSKPVATPSRERESNQRAWLALFQAPELFWDQRLTKVSSRSPDFKHKRTGEALWLNYAPAWVGEQVRSNLPLPLSTVHAWETLLASPDTFWDNRVEKLNPRSPDFNHKVTGAGLWVQNAPAWVAEQVRSTLPLPLSKGDVWKALLADPDTYWDNRSHKLSPRSPDFTHKDTGAGLWVTDAPTWVITRMGSELPLPRTKDELWQAMLEAFDDYWDNRECKPNPRAPDFRHKSTFEALWLSDAPPWVHQRLDKMEAEHIDPPQVRMPRSFQDPLGYYKLLGIDNSASVLDIRAAFFALALTEHPDKKQSSSPTIQTTINRKFQAIQEAADFLRDPVQRKQYDNGETV